MNRRRLRSVELTNPQALRALAHPIRLKLVALLRREDTLTATQAGDRLGQSAASCSFHLRQLAKWGLVEEAGGGRGRERPWRATADSTSWKITSSEMAEPAAALSSLIVRGQFDRILRAMEQLPNQSSEWQLAHQLSDTDLYLTSSQLEELGKRVWELVTSYEKDAASPGARRVGIFFAALPQGEEEL